MIEAHELTKRYGDTTAVHSLSFTIAPGTVTGFLGPNGAGKSTTMRMIMGLDRPTSGTVTVNGKPYRQHRAPLREVGAGKRRAPRPQCPLTPAHHGRHPQHQGLPAAAASWPRRPRVAPSTGPGVPRLADPAAPPARWQCRGPLRRLSRRLTDSDIDEKVVETH